MTQQQFAESLGLKFEKLDHGYLNSCSRSGNLLFVTRHTSIPKGKLGAGLTVEDGYASAQDCAERILDSIWNVPGTIDGPPSEPAALKCELRPGLHSAALGDEWLVSLVA